MRGELGAVMMALALVATATTARAQCSTDQECKGDRICEAGRCVAPVPAAPADTPAEAGAAPPVERERFFEEPDGEPPPKVKKRIGNPGLMIGGIVLASAAPVVLAVGVATASCSSDGGDTRCDIGERVLAFGLISVAMIGAAVPMIVIGAKRVPVRQVAIGPLFAPGLSGLQLQLRL
jgi:hypothetical protein